MKQKMNPAWTVQDTAKLRLLDILNLTPEQVLELTSRAANVIERLELHIVVMETRAQERQEEAAAREREIAIQYLRAGTEGPNLPKRTTAQGRMLVERHMAAEALEKCEHVQWAKSNSSAPPPPKNGTNLRLAQ